MTTTRTARTEKPDHGDHRVARRRRAERGVAAVEFALVLPLFLAVVFGVIEYGWVFYQKFNLASAIRDGLRVGVTVLPAASPDPRASAISRAQADLAAVGIPAGS